MEKLLNGLQIGYKRTSANGGQGDNKCFSTSSLLAVYGLNETLVNETTFARVCPAVVQQVSNQACHRVGGEKRDDHVFKEPELKAWGYGFLATTIVNIAPLIGVTVVPFMSVAVYKTVLLFMVSLAVGVLCGGSVFHLIPMTYGLSSHSDDGKGSHDYLYRTAVLVGGVYLFFVMEYLLRMYVRFNDNAETGPSGGHGHSHQILPLFKGDKHTKDAADIQDEFYNVREDHCHAHSNSLCTSVEVNNIPVPAEPGERDSVTIFTVEEAADVTKTTKSTEKLTMPAKRKVKPIAWTIVIGDCVHNFIDGVAIGAAFSSSLVEGISTALAIIGEEVPHELGDFAVLLSSGMKYRHAVLFNLLSGVICYTGLVLGLLLAYATASVQWIYAIAAGMFLYISLVDMLPEANEMSCKEGEHSVWSNLKTFAVQNSGMLVGFSIMLVLAIYAHDIEL
ncbi:metal cation symporter ZIP14 isoform X2 [Nematostella vectensis]|nr:metal cation symporter ZIP14 isoform X2 [Nematostella vectensis]